MQKNGSMVGGKPVPIKVFLDGTQVTWFNPISSELQSTVQCFSPWSEHKLKMLVLLLLCRCAYWQLFLYLLTIKTCQANVAKPLCYYFISQPY